MTPEELYDLYENNISSVINPSMLATIADYGNNVHGFNFINRVLIYIQNKHATSVMSGEAWEIAGRRLNSRPTAIWVIDQILKTTYTDAETGETIENSDLTLEEIDNAVRLGIFKKSKETIGLKSLPVFSLRDTTVYDSDTYKRYTKHFKAPIKVSGLLGLLSDWFNVQCETLPPKSKSYFDLQTNTLHISNDSIESKIYAIVDAITYQINIEEARDSFISSGGDQECSSAIEGVAKAFIREYIKSIVIPEYFVDEGAFSEVNNFDFSDQNITNYFISIMISAYELAESISGSLRPNTAGFDEVTLRKANQLLNMIEANYEYLRIRGDS